MIYVRSFREKTPEGCIEVNTTSRGSYKGLSPFYCGPIALYDDYVARNVENAWQFSKVYSQHLSKTGKILPAYWDWATKGWDDTYAHRYPMGKGAVPEFSLWKGRRLTYIQARQVIYFPLYKKAVREQADFAKLKKLAATSDVCLIDFDGRLTEESFLEVLRNPKKKMGHAFVLKAMLDYGETITVKKLLLAK